MLSAVVAFRYDAGRGTLAELQTLSTLPEGFSRREQRGGDRRAPGWKFLYTSNRGHDSIASFRIDAAAGTLTPLGSRLDARQDAAQLRDRSVRPLPHRRATRTPAPSSSSGSIRTDRRAHADAATVQVPSPVCVVFANRSMMSAIRCALDRGHESRAAVLCAARARRPAQPPPYQDARLSVDERVRDLLGRMTLEEKFWQLFMIPGDLDDPAHDYSNGIFGLQISRRAPRRQPAATRVAGARRADQRHPALLRREDAARHSRSSRSRRRVHGLARDGATMFPQAIALAATWDTALVGARRRGDRARDPQPRHPPGALARRSTSRTTCGGDAWRRPTARIRTVASVMGRAFIEAVRARRHRHDAQAFRRQRRRRRARQLSDRSQRAAARRSAIFPPFDAAIRAGARALGDDRLQLGGRRAGDAEPRGC